MSYRTLLAIAVACCSQAAGKEVDACKLLTRADIEQAQGSAPVSTRASSHDDGNLTSNQCYFNLSPSSQSVSLEVISRSARDKLDVREFWNEKFHGKQADEDAEGDRGNASHRRGAGEENERRQPPRAVTGIGEEAFWVYTGRDGALYTLQGVYLLRIGIGGKGDEQAKTQSAVSLAKPALRSLADRR